MRTVFWDSSEYTISNLSNLCFQSQYGMNFTAVIPTNIFGKHDNFHLEDSKRATPSQRL
jgi:nucleoside-diphosphate-sugar epimerase